jgi:hypothetical protein
MQKTESPFAKKEGRRRKRERQELAGTWFFM